MELLITDEAAPKISCLQNILHPISAPIRFRPSKSGRKTESLAIGIRVGSSGMGDRIRLIGLREAAEPGIRGNGTKLPKLSRSRFRL